MSAPHTVAQRGFTLVELLVALMLLAFIALGLGGAMRTISQTQERVDRRMQRSERQQVAIQFLRHTLGQVSGLPRPTAATPQGETPSYFQGTAQTLQWLGSMPANFGAGGRSHIRLILQPGSAGNQLVLQYKKWDKNTPNPEWPSANSYVLESNVEALEFSYQRTHRLQGQQWQPVWGVGENTPSRQELPSAIRLQLRTTQGDWPLLIIALHQPLVNNSQSSGGAVFGGSSR